MGARFEGFHAGTCRWFEDLAANNTRDWFAANRALYDTGIRAPMQALMDEAAALHGGSVKLYRQHRDVRFSKDKSPYNLHLRAGIYNRPGAVMGLLCSLEATGFFAGVGLYAMSKPQLARFRAAVDGEDGAALVDIAAPLAAADMPLRGEALSRVPPGHDKGHPRADLLKMKQLFAGRTLSSAQTEAGRKPLEHALSVWEACKPLMVWADTHIGVDD